MNRRTFLCGSTAIGLSALCPGKGLPAAITVARNPVLVVVNGNPVVVDRAPISIQRRAWELLDLKLLPIVERYERELAAPIRLPVTSGTVRFRRPVPFAVAS